MCFYHFWKVEVNQPKFQLWTSFPHFPFCWNYTRILRSLVQLGGFIITIHPSLRYDNCSDCYSARPINSAALIGWYVAMQPVSCAQRKALRVKQRRGCLLLHHHERLSLCEDRGTPESCGAIHKTTAFWWLYRRVTNMKSHETDRNRRTDPKHVALKYLNFNFRTLWQLSVHSKRPTGDSPPRYWLSSFPALRQASI